MSRKYNHLLHWLYKVEDDDRKSYPFYRNYRGRQYNPYDMYSTRAESYIRNRWAPGYDIPQMPRGYAFGRPTTELLRRRAKLRARRQRRAVQNHTTTIMRKLSKRVQARRARDQNTPGVDYFGTMDTDVDMNDPRNVPLPDDEIPGLDAPVPSDRAQAMVDIAESTPEVMTDRSLVTHEVPDLDMPTGKRPALESSLLVTPGETPMQEVPDIGNALVPVGSIEIQKPSKTKTTYVTGIKDMQRIRRELKEQHGVATIINNNPNAHT